MLQLFRQEPRLEEGFLPLALDRYLESARRILSYRKILNLFEFIFPKEYGNIPKKTQLSQLSTHTLAAEERAFFAVFQKSLSDSDELDELFGEFVDELETEMENFAELPIPWTSWGYCLNEIEYFSFAIQILMVMTVHGYCPGYFDFEEFVANIGDPMDYQNQLLFKTVDRSPLLLGLQQGAFEIDIEQFYAPFRQLEPPLQYFADAIDVFCNFSGNLFLCDPEMEPCRIFYWNLEDIANYRLEYESATKVLERMNLLVEWLESDPVEHFALLFEEWTKIYQHLFIQDLPLLQLLASYQVKNDSNSGQSLSSIFGGDLELTAC
jgi:hypothetical protein